MFYPVFFEVNIFRTSGDFNIPTIFMPNFTNLLKSFYDFYALSKVGFGILHILLCKKHSFLNKVVLNLAISFYINETEYKLICVTFQFISNVPNARQEVTRSDVWRNY